LTNSVNKCKNKSSEQIVINSHWRIVVIPIPKNVEKFGHGRVWCSCGKMLSNCGCHTNYAIKIQSCDGCLGLLDPPPPIKRKKHKKKTHKVPIMPHPANPVEVMSEKQLRKLLIGAREHARGHDTEELLADENENLSENK